MSTEKIKTINGKELMQMEFSPIRFIAEDFIPQGLHIFAGMPKVGKSWLLLLLCLKVAQGEKFWNYQTEKGTVLYLCLEDSYNRVQMRLSEITEDAPESLHFAVMVNSLSNGLLEQIELFISEHPDTNLIVIDTLQKVRDGTGDSNYYAGDYKDIGALKSIADKNGIAILAVQHRRKQKSDDPHISISGSTGMTGASDGSYVLVRPDEKSNDAKLYIRGRDIEEKQLRMTMRKNVWEVTEALDAAGLRRERAPHFLFQIADYLLKEKSFTGTMEELLAAIADETTAANVASKLVTRYFNDVFKPLGLKMDRKRIAAARLMVWKLDDDDDGNDDQRRSETLASLRQQHDDTLSFPQTSSQSSFASWFEITDPGEELPFK
jgi:hypothetical protein